MQYVGSRATRPTALDDRNGGVSAVALTIGIGFGHIEGHFSSGAVDGSRRDRTTPRVGSAGCVPGAVALCTTGLRR
eukprot:6472311-Prymnesium_polylepis.1